MYIINLIITILILSISVLQFYTIIKRYKKKHSIKVSGILFAMSYTYIFNFFCINFIQYIDSFIISMSILLYIIAIKKIIIEKNLTGGVILTILGVICYQGTIPIYIATAILVAILETKKIDKNFFAKILPCAITIIISSLISCIIVNLIPVVTNMQMTERIETENFFGNIKTNFKEMINAFIYSCDLFPPYAWLIFTEATLIVGIGHGIKEKNLNFIFNIMFIFVCYISSSLIMLPLFFAPRVILVVAQSVTAMLIYSYCDEFKNSKRNIFENVVAVIMIVYFVLTLISIFESTYYFKKGNELDEEFAMKIESEIKELESNDEKIEKIAIKYNITGKNLEKYDKRIFHNSRYLKCMYSIGIFEFYTGRKIELVSANEIDSMELDLNSDNEFETEKIDNLMIVLVNI